MSLRHSAKKFGKPKPTRRLPLPTLVENDEDDDSAFVGVIFDKYFGTHHLKKVLVNHRYNPNRLYNKEPLPQFADSTREDPYIPQINTGSTDEWLVAAGDEGEIGYQRGDEDEYDQWAREQAEDEQPEEELDPTQNFWAGKSNCAQIGSTQAGERGAGAMNRPMGNIRSRLRPVCAEIAYQISKSANVVENVLLPIPLDLTWDNIHTILCRDFKVEGMEQQRTAEFQVSYYTKKKTGRAWVVIKSEESWRIDVLEALWRNHIALEEQGRGGGNRARAPVVESLLPLGFRLVRINQVSTYKNSQLVYHRMQNQ